MMIQSLEEPDDPYGLNYQWYNCPAALASIITSMFPVVGLAGTLMSALYYYEHRSNNQFNIAECSRVATLIGLFLQVNWAIAFVAWWSL